MRLKEISEIRDSLSNSIQALPDKVLKQSDRTLSPMILREPLQRRLGRLLGPSILAMQQYSIRSALGRPIPFSYDILCLGERFSTDTSKAECLKKSPFNKDVRLLVIGCNNGHDDDVQCWLRSGAKHLQGIDLYSFEEPWRLVAPALSRHFQAEISFRQAAIESLPHQNEHFDVMVSTSVLEHIHDLPRAVNEMARVMRPGGLAWHSFGPLYYSFSGDHCISSYGLEHGYNHLLLDEANYRQKISDQSFYDTQRDPRNNYWAKSDQFSFLKAEEYLHLFSKHFVIEHLLVKISKEGLSYRKLFRENWEVLTSNRISEIDLLISGLIVILRKKQSIQEDGAQ